MWRHKGCLFPEIKTSPCRNLYINRLIQTLRRASLVCPSRCRLGEPLVECCQCAIVANAQWPMTNERGAGHWKMVIGYWILSYWQHFTAPPPSREGGAKRRGEYSMRHQALRTPRTPCEKQGAEAESPVSIVCWKTNMLFGSKCFCCLTRYRLSDLGQVAIAKFGETPDAIFP